MYHILLFIPLHLYTFAYLFFVSIFCGCILCTKWVSFGYLQIVPYTFAYTMYTYACIVFLFDYFVDVYFVEKGLFGVFANMHHKFLLI